MVKETPTVPRASGAPMPELAAFLRPLALLFRNWQNWQSVERCHLGAEMHAPTRFPPAALAHPPSALMTILIEAASNVA